MPRFICLSLALALPTAALASTVSFSTHAAQCSSNLCTLTSLYHADLNGDGLEDLVAVDGPNYGNFRVTFNQGNGSFSAPVNYALPIISSAHPDEVGAFITGDFSHHGSIDLAVFGFDSGNLYIYTNNGKGAFTPTKTLQFSSSGGNYGHISAVQADFNRDNNPDIAFTIDTQLHIWLGDGKGGFAPSLSQSVQGNTLATGDFDGDGKADLLISGDQASLSSAYAYYGDGTGHFPVWNTVNLPGGYTVFSVGDVNSDGRSDIIASGNAAFPKAVKVFYGNATNRAFPSRTTIPVGGCISQAGVAIADLDGNGYNDLIVTETPCSNGDPTYVEVLTRNPNSSYNPPQILYTVPDPASGVNQVFGVPLVLHSDRNSKPDLLFQQCLGKYCADGVSTITLLNTTAGNFPTCEAPAAAEGISVCSPPATTGSTTVTFNLGAAMPTAARNMNVWVDGKKVAEQIDGFSNYTYLTKSVSLSLGNHQVTVYAAGWDQSTIRKSFTVNVQ